MTDKPRANDGKADDFTSRLRACGYASGDEIVAGMCNNAAERIERFEREVARLTRVGEMVGASADRANAKLMELKSRFGEPIANHFRDDGTQGEDLSGIPNGFREHVEKVAKGEADIETLLPNWKYIRRQAVDTMTSEAQQDDTETQDAERTARIRAIFDRKAHQPHVFRAMPETGMEHLCIECGTCNSYKRPDGVVGGSCLTCGTSQPEHVQHGE